MARFPLEIGIADWKDYLNCIDDDHMLLLEFMPYDKIDSLLEEADSLREIIRLMDRYKVFAFMANVSGGGVKMNVNRFLENGKRIGLFGRNIYTSEGVRNRERGQTIDNDWEQPKPGMQGALYIGHGTPFADVVIPHFYEEDRELMLSSVRHQWTPAWTKTYFRSQPDTNYYKFSGCISLSESKCITTEDVFYSKVEVFSDKREETTIRIKLETKIPGNKVCMPINGLHEMPKDSIWLNGCFSLKNSTSSENEFVLHLPPNGCAEFTYAFAFAENETRADELAEKVLSKTNPIGEKEKAFNDFMTKSIPVLECDDMDVLRLYYYRWFLVYLSMHKPEDVISGHPIEGICFYESSYNGSMAIPIGLPVPMHLEEARWMTSPEAAFSDATNWARELPYYWLWYIEYTPMAIWNVYSNHPDDDFLRKVYPACLKYSTKDFKTEETQYKFLPLMAGSWCTGAEYQPAFYQYTEEPWDWTKDTEGVRLGLSDELHPLYRLDHICYSIGNLIACMKMALKLRMKDDAEKLQLLIERSTAALKEYFWCEEKECFTSIDAKTGQHCSESVCYDSFFPFLWNIVGKEYYKGFNLLFDRDSFAGKFSVTTVDKKCPMYWFDDCIAGPTKSSVKEPHLYGCCWNGPVWPYAVSGVLDALGTAAATDQSLQEEWMGIFDGYNEVHFFKGDRSIPMIFECYRPTDGVNFGNIYDYFHSKWIDLFMRYWCGISYEDGVVKFAPFATCQFTLRNVQLGGKTYDFMQKQENGTLKRIIKKQK